MIGYNRTCNLSDWRDLAPLLRDIYPYHADGWPVGSEYRKEWEVAQSVRGLRDFGALGPDKRILGVGAGHETTLYYLTNYAEMVYATDLYGVGGWPNWADPEMLIAPDKYIVSGYPWNAQRLRVEHMDGCKLRYPDAYFDGIFSASSVEHFGGFDQTAQSMREMYRVLKPGGIIAITTEMKLKPSPNHGWSNTLLLEPEEIQQYIIEASTCDIVDPLDYTVEPETLATVQDFDKVLRDSREGIPIPAPHIVLLTGEYLFTSVSVTLRKPPC